MTASPITINDKEWRLKNVERQFLHTRVIHSEDIIQSLAAGFACFERDIDDSQSKMVACIPITITGSGETYNEAWNGVIRADGRQHTHIAVINGDEVESLKQLKCDLEDIEALCEQLTSDPSVADIIFKKMRYEPHFITCGIVSGKGDVMELPTRFLPPVHTQAREVCMVVKHTQEIADYGYEFKVRGPFTHYLILITPNKKWIVCARTADSKEPLPIADTINEKVMIFDCDNEDKVIEYLLEVGFDEHDPDLDYITEKMVEASLLD